MDPNIVIGIIVVLLVLVLLGYLKSPTFKGIVGEFRVRRALGKNKEDEKYVINDITIMEEGRSHQIDHILIKKTGITVIETKNHAGQIFGNETQLNWTQTLRYGKVKNKFYNPIKQNKTHIYALSQVLNLNGSFTSVIVFPRATLRTNTETPVGDISLLKRIIKNQFREVYTSEEIKSFYNTLLEIKRRPAVSKRQHVKQIKQMKKDVDNNICPRCGAPLVVRQVSRGGFYGCSSYPSCTFKKPL